MRKAQPAPSPAQTAAFLNERRVKDIALNELIDRDREIEILRLEVELWKRRAKTNGETARQYGQELKDLREELEELR